MFHITYDRLRTACHLTRGVPATTSSLDQQRRRVAGKGEVLGNTLGRERWGRQGYRLKFCIGMLTLGGLGDNLGDDLGYDLRDGLRDGRKRRLSGMLIKRKPQPHKAVRLETANTPYGLIMRVGLIHNAEHWIHDLYSRGIDRYNKNYVHMTVYFRRVDSILRYRSVNNTVRPVQREMRATRIKGY